jgi:two-component sensor histidine kinase/CheY-like chemotaxis protein
MVKVLIAEDDLLMADMLADVLIESGYEVCGIARTVDEGVTLGELHRPDLALLDMRLAGGGLGTEIAARLDRTGGLGILYATGNAGQLHLTKGDGEAYLGKPYRSADVIRSLKIVEEIIRTGMASRPFPDGFHVLGEQLSGAQAQFTNSTSGDGKLRDIHRLLRQQAALARFGGFAMGESDLGKVLTEAARVCAEGLAVPFCKVCRYRPEANDLLVEAGVGWHSGVIGCVVSRADRSSPQGRAFITGEPVICSDLNKDASFVLPAFYAEHGIVSTVDVVIKKQDGQPWGVLEIDNPSQHDYDEHDVDFLTGFANVLAEAVNTSKRNIVLQNTIDLMKDMVADKDRLLVAKNAILEENNVFAQELQHRVRNNLQLIYAMLNKQMTTVTDIASAKEGFRAIARRVMTLAKVYDHLLGTGLSRMIDFSAYLKSLCFSFKDMESAFNEKIGLTCELESTMLDLDTVTALGLIVAELLANSYLHAFPGGTGMISVSLHPCEAGDEATIVFADDGIGFTEKDDSKRHGVGLVKRLMEQVDGSAELRSDHGTIWTLKFPMPTAPLSGGASGMPAS